MICIPLHNTLFYAIAIFPLHIKNFIENCRRLRQGKSIKKAHQTCITARLTF